MNTQITEDYVSFETAKLLKEKGFDGNTNCYYIEGSAAKDIYYSPIRKNHNKRITNDEFDIHIDITSSRISAPTLQMAMKWLREIRKINIEIFTYWSIQEKAVYGNRIVSVEHANVFKEIDIAYDTYEQACEEAIKYCLENLI